MPAAAPRAAAARTILALARSATSQQRGEARLDPERASTVRREKTRETAFLQGLEFKVQKMVPHLNNLVMRL